MRFDDTLATVLAGDLSTPYGKQSAWRQIVDLIGRRRVPPDSRALAILRQIRPDVPPPVRAATARALEYANPPSPLVRLFALDEIAIAIPVLRSARMTSAEWIQLLPDLAPGARAVLRNRRDLSPIVRRALETYGPIDFVLSDESRKEEAESEVAVEERLPEPEFAAEIAGMPVPELEPVEAAIEAPVEEAVLPAEAPPVLVEPAVEEPVPAPPEPVAAVPAPPPEQLVDWTDVLDSPAHRESRIALPVAAAAVPEPAPAEPAPQSETVVSEEDLSFVALAGFAAALPNATVVAPAENQFPPLRDQSGTLGAPPAEEPIAEPVAEAQGPVEASGDLAVLEELTEAAKAAPAPQAMNDTEAPEGPFQISEVVARIDAFWKKQQEHPGEESPARAPRPAQDFRFETDAKGVIRWVEGASRAPLVGLSLDFQGAADGSRVDGVATGAFRRRAGFSNARMAVEGDSDASGAWLISAIPVFDPANGRFTGYRGTARRPRADERAEPARPARNAAPDSLRQLVHELRTPTNAIAGFAEMIETQMLGPVSDPYRDRANVIRAQARELLGAIDDLDLAARIESDALSLVPGRVSLRPVLINIADDLAQLAELRGSYIALPIDDMAVSGDRRAVERLLARLMATLVSASGEGERIGVRTALEGDETVAITLDRPRTLADYPGDSLLGIDDEREDATLLGTGFALRLARNLARELGGGLVIEGESLTLRLPASVNATVGQAHLS